ncbi:MAG: hypothetical protein KGI00_05540 [Candidatus Micrarchaeota archaeon]|nr:hypothetical protein [Candidatus Micrarchaeota archaeon]MDE1824192.1 hypothetical protein [Candidatus Micrarchaeota archaeon]MDE1850157.1 hypothetical protein [Candidatus Micrarchaeota archaeon]
MTIRLNPSACYIAGLMSRTREKGKVAISTSKSAIEQKFIEIAVKKLKVDPKKITIQEGIGVRNIYFYHSRIAKELQEVREKELFIFKRMNEFSRSYVAGMFDSSGHLQKGTIYINGLTPKDRVMLDNLGIKTLDNRVVNSKSFLDVIKGYSVFEGLGK